MYKNQLQELAQRSCFNLPSYACIREGPDHAPRFKAAVNFNGETFESPSYCSTLRQAEHSAAEVALNALATRGPSSSLAARILDETGVYKNLLQEVSQRVGASLPSYTTFRTGRGHLPVFTGTVELAGVIFTGEPAKNKKQAEKNAAMSAWLSLKLLVQQFSEGSTSERTMTTHKDEQEHITVARALHKYLIKARLARIPFPIKFPTPNPKPSSSTHQPPPTTSRILPLICPKTTPPNHNKPTVITTTTTSLSNTATTTQNQHPYTTNETRNLLSLSFMDNLKTRPSAGAAPYIPVRHYRTAPPVTIRNAVPVFSAPPVNKSSSSSSSLVIRPPPPPVYFEDPRLLTRPRVDESPFPKLPLVSQTPRVPLVRVEKPIGSKLLLPVGVTPNSQVPRVRPPGFEFVSVSPLPGSKASAEETEEDLKELKI